MDQLQHALHPARHEGETFAAYRDRRKDGNTAVKKYLRGRLVKEMVAAPKHSRRRRMPLQIPVNAEFFAAVNSMTNWANTQWSRAGWPGLRKKETELLNPFLPKEARV